MLFLHGHGVGTSRAVRIFKTYGADAIAGHLGEPLPPGRATSAASASRAPIRSRAARDREDGDDPRPGRDRLRAGRGAWTRAIAACRWTSCACRRRRCSRSRPSWCATALALELAEGAVVDDTVGGAPACSWPGSTAPSSASPSGCAASPGGSRPGSGRSPSKAIPWVEAQDRPDPGRQPAGGGAPGAALQGPGDHRRPRRRQDHAGQRHPRDPAGQDGAHRPVRTHRPGRQADARGHRPRGQDPPSSARGRSGAAAASSGSEEHPLDCELLVVDEVSMVDVPLMHALLKAVPPRAA